MSDMKKMNSIRAAAIMLAAFLLLPACNKNNDQELMDQEMRLLQKYIEDNNINQEPTASGLYYLPITEGTGSQVGPGSYVDFNYNTRLLDGTLLFTSYEDVAKANDVYVQGALYGPIRLLAGNTGVPGLNEGLQLMRAGGKAKLIMPSSINGFGGVATENSPPYSTHIYTVDLIHAFDDPAGFQAEQISLYLAEHGIVKPFISASGLYYVETQAGEGDLITDADKADIWYTGSFLDGRVFDSNVGKQVLPVDLSLSHNFIPGWIEGIKLMRNGTQAKLIIPYQLAYGEAGNGKIPPYMTLVFDMEVDTVVSGN